MYKYIKAGLLALIAVLLVATPVFAYLYRAPIAVIESGSTAYTMLPWMVRANNQWMADNGFMEADALDTRVQTLGGLNKPHMISTIRTLSATGVPADSQTNLYLATGETDLSSFDIITGYDGYVTIPDDASIELASAFEVEQKGWIDTDAGSDKNLVYKEDAFRTYISANEEITSVIFDTIDPASVPGAVNAYMYKDNANYNTARTAVAATALGPNLWIGQRTGFKVYRGFVWFDTSPIPDGATITSATLHLQGSLDNSDADFDVVIQSGMPLHPEATLVIGDFDLTFYSGNYGEMNTVDFIVGDNPIELTAGGLAIIDKTGTTKFCLRSGEDIDNSEPVGNEWIQGTTATTTLTVDYETTGVTATGVSSGEHTVTTLISPVLDFDGVDDYVDCGSDASLGVTEITFGGWCYRQVDSGGYERWLSKSSAAVQDYWLQIGDTDVIKFEFLDTLLATQSLSTVWTMPVDEWHHIIATYDGSVQRIYVDGALKVTSGVIGNPIRVTAPALPFRMGRLQSWYDFDGLAGEIVVYNQALTGPEVLTLYGGEVSTTNLVGWWKLDEGTGTVATDSSGNGNTGTIYDGIAPGSTWTIGLLKILIDGGVSGIAGGAAVPANANDYTIMENNCIPYMEYMTIDVAGVEELKYLPVDMIADTQVDGIADAGSSDVKLIDAELTQADDYWNLARLIITETDDHLAPEGETAVVTDFLQATDELQFAALTAVVEAGDTYDVSFGTLVDETGTNDGTITWGHNPTGVTVTLGSMASSGQPAIGTAIEDIPTSVLPPAEVSDWFGDGTVGGAILTNPVRPFITMVSDNTDLNEIQVWRWMGIALLLFIAVAVARVLRGHLGITAIVVAAAMGGLVAVDHNIFPLWLLVMAVGMFVGGIVAERSPSL